MNYIHHSNNVIDRPMGALPRAAFRTSGLDKASAASLREKGWLPVVESKPAFNPATETLIGPTGVSVGDPVMIDAKEVTAVWVAVPYTPPVPQSITPLQARKVLRANGMMGAVASFIASAEPAIKDAWEAAIAFDRNDELITTAAAALGLSDAQLDAMFIQAAEL